MPPVTTTTITLRCPFPDGSNGQHVDITFQEFDASHAPVNPPLPLNALSNQTSVVSATVNPDGNNPLTVRIKTIGPKPANLSSMSVFVDAGQTKNGVLQKDTITVQLQSSGDGTEFSIANVGQVVDD